MDANRVRLALAVAIVAMAAPAAAQFQPASATAATAAIDLPLPPDGVVPIVVLRSGTDANATFSVAVSGLQDATGAPVTGTLNGTPASAAVRLTAPDGVARLELRIRPVPPTGQVSGLLTIEGRSCSKCPLTVGSAVSDDS